MSQTQAQKEGYAILSIIGIGIMLVSLSVWIITEKGLVFAWVGFSLFIFSTASVRGNFRMANKTPKESTE